jgi:hypothetical protein
MEKRDSPLIALPLDFVSYEGFRVCGVGNLPVPLRGTLLG